MMASEAVAQAFLPLTETDVRMIAFASAVRSAKREELRAATLAYTRRAKWDSRPIERIIAELKACAYECMPYTRDPRIRTDMVALIVRTAIDGYFAAT